MTKRAVAESDGPGPNSTFMSQGRLAKHPPEKVDDCPHDADRETFNFVALDDAVMPIGSYVA
jgi:hypothetical protein